MIYGVGSDLIEIERVGKAVENPAFIRRVYGEREAAFLARNGRAESYAANFAAKEAFSKSVGTGFRGFGLREVEVFRDPLGKPYFKLSGGALAVARRDDLSFFLSLSHLRGYAMAVVVCEKLISERRRS